MNKNKSILQIVLKYLCNCGSWDQSLVQSHCTRATVLIKKLECSSEGVKALSPMDRGKCYYCYALLKTYHISLSQSKITSYFLAWALWGISTDNLYWFIFVATFLKLNLVLCTHYQFVLTIMFFLTLKDIILPPTETMFPYLGICPLATAKANNSHAGQCQRGCDTPPQICQMVHF